MIEITATEYKNEKFWMNQKISFEPNLPLRLEIQSDEKKRKLTSNTPSVVIRIRIICHKKRALSFNCSTFFHIEVSNSKWFKLMAQKIEKIVIEKHFAQDHVLHLKLAKAFTHKLCGLVKPLINFKSCSLYPKGHVCARCSFFRAKQKVDIECKINC